MTLEVKGTKKYYGTVYDMAWEVRLILSMEACKKLDIEVPPIVRSRLMMAD